MKAFGNALPVVKLVVGSQKTSCSLLHIPCSFRHHTNFRGSCKVTRGSPAIPSSFGPTLTGFHWFQRVVFAMYHKQANKSIDLLSCYLSWRPKHRIGQLQPRNLLAPLTMPQELAESGVGISCLETSSLGRLDSLTQARGAARFSCSAGVSWNYI